MDGGSGLGGAIVLGLSSLNLVLNIREIIKLEAYQVQPVKLIISRECSQIN